MSIQSVLDQDYANIEIIVVDDASTDKSQEEIANLLEGKPEIYFLSLDKNLGNTSAFNQGLALAQGKYIVDLACDDVMLRHRISSQVTFFEEQSQITGVIYSDAEYIDENGVVLGRHFEDGRRIPYEGDVYSQLVSDYFIHPTTMMIKKSVFDDLKGYDTSLAYEDFDFWVRSSRIWNYSYQDEVLTQIRKVSGSHGSTLYSKTDKKLISTVAVCRKILTMNRSLVEDEALIVRLKYEIKHAYLTGNKIPIQGFLQILSEMESLSWQYKLLGLFNWGVDFSFFRNITLIMKYGSTNI